MVWRFACPSRASREPIGSLLLRGFDVASIFVLSVDESSRCFAGVCPDECGDACGGRVWICRVSAVYECAGERAPYGGRAFYLVKEDKGKDQDNTPGVWGATCCALRLFGGDRFVRVVCTVAKLLLRRGLGRREWLCGRRLLFAPVRWGRNRSDRTPSSRWRGLASWK